MIIGLTGGIGAGKSVIGRILESFGFPVYYSDFEAKKLMNTDPIIREELSKLLDEEIYKSGQLDRERLAKIIFSSAGLRDEVNHLIHPRVREHFNLFCEENSMKKLIFNEAAILFETGAYENFDKNILVIAPDELRIKRVMKRDNISEQEVKNRINAQWSDARKKKLADHIIVNDGKTALLDQVKKIVDQLISS